MKKIKIKQLALRNFKGVNDLVVNFYDKETRIHGDNATGKTTLLDAFTWLLFGKDSQDRKDFKIKPLDADGNSTEKIESEVSAIFEIDGNRTTIRRVLAEKWVKKRGEERAEFSGNETRFFWDEVPYSLGEFEAKVHSIIDEQLFKLTTNVSRFPQLPWKEQRLILFNIAGVQSDDEIADLLPASKSEVRELVIKTLGADKTLEQYKKEIASKKKIIKDELERIPAGIAELHRIKPEIEFSKEALMKGIEELKSSINQYDEEITNENKRLNALHAEAQDAQRENNRQLSEFRSDLEKYVAEKNLELNQRRNDLILQQRQIQNNIGIINSTISNVNAKIEAKKRDIDFWTKDKTDLLEAWKSENAKTFIAPAQEENCHACGQPVKHEIDIEGYRTKFNNKKAQTLEEINKRGIEVKEKIEAIEKEIKALEEENESYQYKKLELLADFAKIDVPETSKFEGDEKTKFYNDEILKLANNVFVVEEDTEAVSKLKEFKSSLSVDLENSQRELLKYDELNRIEARISELSERESSLAYELSQFEKEEFQIEEFTKFKIDSVEKRINSMFDFVRFKMFNKLVNGGVEETCEATIFGVPYSDANNAAKINAGLDIIGTLSKHFEIEAPCFIDNAESVTRFTSFTNQLILLIVDANAKILEVK